MSNHTYWRLYITKSMAVPTSNWWWYTIAEIEFRATVGGADQCTGGIATAHDYYNSSVTPAKAFDNNYTTSYWGSWSSNQVPGWIKYQFASPVDVAEVAITNRDDTAGGTNYAPKDFQLQWSDDNSNWTTVGSWTGQSFTQGQTRTFQATVYAKNQNKEPYGLSVAVARTLPFSALVAAAQSHLFDMPPLIIQNQVAMPFSITMATSQWHLFDMPPLIVSNHAAMPFGTLLAVDKEHYYPGDIVLEFTASYDMTIRAASSLVQSFGVEVAKGVVSPYALAVATSLTTGYGWIVEKSLEQPYSGELVTGYSQPYSLSLAVQNAQSFDIPFVSNSCTHPYPIQLELYHVQTWQVPVAQANVQPLYDTVCAAGRQPWSILLPVAQANGQLFDRTNTVAKSLEQNHDLLERNPVAKSLTGSWDLSSARPPLRLNGGVRAFHLGVQL